ncbi:MAG: hypothetical protein JO022_14695 [Acidobacteriaceae bacterium]|nr:hypothetical protein [Acidobacteriaceae bacterium]
MRRLWAVVLVAVFSASPIFFASFSGTASQLPACCRRSGTHKCSMQTRVPAGQSVHGKCPFSGLRRTDGLLTGSGIPALSQIAHGVFAPRTAVQTAEISRFRSELTRSHQKRGPPSLLV